MVRPTPASLVNRCSAFEHNSKVFCADFPLRIRPRAACTSVSATRVCSSSGRPQPSLHFSVIRTRRLLLCAGAFGINPAAPRSSTLLTPCAKFRVKPRFLTQPAQLPRCPSSSQELAQPTLAASPPSQPPTLQQGLPLSASPASPLNKDRERAQRLYRPLRRVAPAIRSPVACGLANTCVDSRPVQRLVSVEVS